MAQTPCTYRQDDRTLDYTPGSAVLAGTVVVRGNMVTIVPVDIGASDKGSEAIEGVWNVPKDNSDVADGDLLYWNATGDPVSGTAGSGAFTKTGGANKLAGVALEAAGTGVGDVDMILLSEAAVASGGVFGSVGVPATVAVGGTVIANANAVTEGFTQVTGADDTAAIRLPEAAAGKVVIVKNVVSNKILKVFPAVGDTINNAAANAVYNQTNGAFRMYIAYNSVNWWTDPETIA